MAQGDTYPIFLLAGSPGFLYYFSIMGFLHTQSYLKALEWREPMRTDRSKPSTEDLDMRDGLGHCARLAPALTMGGSSGVHSGIQPPWLWKGEASTGDTVFLEVCTGLNSVP